MLCVVAMASVPPANPGRPQNLRVPRETPAPAPPPPPVARPRPARPSVPWSQRLAQWSQTLSVVPVPVLPGLARESFRERPDGARGQVRDALALMGDLESAQLGSSSRVQEVHRDETGDLSVMLGGTYVWLGRGPYRSKLTRLRVVLA